MKISSSKYLHVSEASSSSPSVMGTWVGLSSMPSYSTTFSRAWPDLVRLRLWGDNGLSCGFYRWLLCRGGHGLSVCSGLWRDGRLGSESGVGLATSSTGQMVKANPQFTSTTPQNVAKLSIHAFHSEGLIQCPNPFKGFTLRSESFEGLKGVGRHGLAIGSTGTFPGGLAADLARCPVFFIFCFVFFCLPNVPK